MARNLYDMGDKPASAADGWLREQQDGRARILPRGAMLLALALGGTGALLLKDIIPSASRSDAVSAITVVDAFAACDDPAGSACLLSAGRFAWHGRSYRIADVAAPEVASAGCEAEAEIAQKARATMLALMNGGAFEARPAPGDDNARILVRDGVSLGSILILKGYAKPVSDKSHNWCA
jgi:hypothetical protein